MILKSTKHLITLVNSNAASREPLIIFIALMVSPSANWRAEPDRSNMSNGISLVYTRCYSSLPTMLDLNQALIWTFDASDSQTPLPFMKIMQRFILMQNTSKRDWVGGGEIFASLFFKKDAHFGQYWKLPKFSRLDPAHHNIKLYDLLMVYPFDPGHSQYC